MSWLLTFAIVQWTIRIGMVPVILRRRFSPGTSLAWLSIIFFVPELGLLIYWLVGSNRLSREKVKLHRRFLERINHMEKPARISREHVIRPELEPAQRILVAQAERLSGMPILGGNHVDLMGGTDAVIDALVAAIDAAERHVHLLFYIYEPDTMGRRVAAALQRAARRGVRCRVLLDAVGSRRMFQRSGLAASLNATGVQCVAALPVAPLRRGLARLDLRNHRKLAVIDGRLAFTGSQNIVVADYGHWRAGPWHDMTGRFTGPIVAALQQVFVSDWAFETGDLLDGDDLFPPLEAVGAMQAQCVPSGPTLDSQALLRMLVAAVSVAQRKVIITSPYLGVDEPMMLALSMAAERGVDLTLIVPEHSDHPLVAMAGRDCYEPLLEAGMKIYLHQQGLLHAKTMTVDDSFALLGSSNLDIRSFYLNFELNVLMYGPQITRELRFAQQSYLNQSRPLTLEQWRRRPLWRRYAQHAAALLSPIL
jgi:cardiolipin synthase A/B